MRWRNFPSDVSYFPGDRTFPVLPMSVLSLSVRARQRLSVVELREEALDLYRAARAARRITQAKLAARAGTTQSAISAAINAAPEEATTHASAYARIVNALSDRYSVAREETVEYIVARKDRTPEA